jgi:hypothetical protein
MTPNRFLNKNMAFITMLLPRNFSLKNLLLFDFLLVNVCD